MNMGDSDPYLGLENVVDRSDPALGGNVDHGDPSTFAPAAQRRNTESSSLGTRNTRMTGSDKSVLAFRTGIALAAATSLLTIWTTIVRDDGTGAGYFMLIMAAGVGGFAASFQAAGMARTMVGVALMQALLGVLMATAPSTANLPGGPAKVLLFSGVFSLLWIASAVLFRAADRLNKEQAVSNL